MTAFEESWATAVLVWCMLGVPFAFVGHVGFLIWSGGAIVALAGIVVILVRGWRRP